MSNPLHSINSDGILPDIRIAKEKIRQYKQPEYKFTYELEFGAIIKTNKSQEEVEKIYNQKVIKS
jgi:hypothetical protein